MLFLKYLTITFSNRKDHLTLVVPKIQDIEIFFSKIFIQIIHSSLSNGMKAHLLSLTAAQSQVTDIWSLLQPPVTYHNEFSPILWVKRAYKLENCAKYKVH